MTRLWFRAKTYGYGWFPITREGWLVIAAYLFLIIVPAAFVYLLGLDHFSRGIFVMFYYLPSVFLLTCVLLWICIKKGEKAGWRWGK